MEEDGEGGCEGQHHHDGGEGENQVEQVLWQETEIIYTNFKSGQGLPLRGSKRHILGEMEGPAKRQKKFSKLLIYWEGKDTKCENDNPAMAAHNTNNLQCGMLMPRTRNFNSEVKATVDLRQNEIVRPT